MHPSLARLHLNEGDEQDDSEQHHRSCGTDAEGHAAHVKLVIDITDDRDEEFVVADGPVTACSENADDA